MEETARSIHPQLVRNMKQASEDCDRLGNSGANIYCCNGYSSPMHGEEDISPGLCSQEELRVYNILKKRVDEENIYHEFGFINLQYGYYIKTESNSLWYVRLISYAYFLHHLKCRSFDSRLLHGTMLPSRHTVLRLRGGYAGDRQETVSTGKHKTTRKRDVKRAQADADVRQRFGSRTQYWEQQGRRVEA